MNRPTVWVVQDPHHKEILQAQEHGKLFVMLTNNENIGQAQQKLERLLEDMTSTDFILPIGNVVNIGLAMHIALRNLGAINLLVWNRQTYTYQIERITDESIKPAHATTDL